MAKTLGDTVVRIPVTVDASETVGFARTLLIEHKIRHLPVLNGNTVVGVVSERDIFLADALCEGADDLTVDRVMSKNPYVVESVADIATTAREMAARRVGSAVMVDGGQVVGMFTTTDALRVLADAMS